MNTAVSELSREGLAAYTLERAPAYREINERLRGELGSLATTEGVQALESNVKLIGDIVNTLPVQSSFREGNFLQCENGKITKKVKGSTMRYRPISSPSGMEWPCFKIGEKPAGRWKLDWLLMPIGEVEHAIYKGSHLASARQLQGGPVAVRLWARSARRIEKKLERHLHPLEEGSLRDDLAPASKEFRIYPTSSGVPLLTEPASDDSGTRVKTGIDFTNGLSSLEIKEFNIYPHIFHLTNLFDRTAEVGNILEQARIVPRA